MLKSLIQSTLKCLFYVLVTFSDTFAIFFQAWTPHISQYLSSQPAHFQTNEAAVTNC